MLSIGPHIFHVRTPTRGPKHEREYARRREQYIASQPLPPVQTGAEGSLQQETRCPEYRLLKLIGKGSQACVWEALDTNTGQYFAAKKVMIQRVDVDSRAEFDAVKREIEILKNMSHVSDY